MIQIVKKPKGWQRAGAQVGLTAAAAHYATIQWPDYNEHDTTKEVALVKRIKFFLSSASIATVAAAVSEVYHVGIGFRPGFHVPTSLTAIPDGDYMQKLVKGEIHAEFRVAAAAQAVLTLKGVLDFADDPIVANPLQNMYCIWIDSPDATTVFVNGEDFFMEVEYQWQVAKQEDLQAYLGWEALA